MKTFVIAIDKNKVYEEVDQTTSYTGAKMEGDDNAYDRIFTTEADRSQLERFWAESRGTVCQALRNFLSNEEETADGRYNLTLSLSSSFDSALVPSMTKELFSFFVLSIAAKWYVFTNKREALEYAETAAGMLESVHRKACHKTRPKRPTSA